MKIALHMSVTLALVLTLVSGLCLGCVEACEKHNCCHDAEQTPSCHQPTPDEQERCDCPDTGHILASAVEAKQTGKQSSEPLLMVAVADIAGAAAPVAGLLPQANTLVLPSHDILTLNTILRI